MVAGIAWVAEQRPLPMLRWLAAALTVLVLARIGWEPRIVGNDIGTTPIFNWILWGYGIPALSFWVAGHLLRQRADDMPARVVESAAILFTVLLAFLEVRHFMTGGDIYRDTAASPSSRCTSASGWRWRSEHVASPRASSTTSARRDRGGTSAAARLCCRDPFGHRRAVGGGVQPDPARYGRRRCWRSCWRCADASLRPTP